ncbi:tRNA-dependent cyclodipeptide synthase [Streptomyces virginiae]|uniref:tRNA-dependent cyclodipeptide synthase n=1 Tax=Streptomyces virginiae TaxID=1961 RepID=UPI00339041AF
MAITADASFDAPPSTRTRRHVPEDGGPAPIGLRPGSGHFSAERIADLPRWPSTRLARVAFVHADLRRSKSGADPFRIPVGSRPPAFPGGLR